MSSTPPGPAPGDHQARPFEPARNDSDQTHPDRIKSAMTLVDRRGFLPESHRRFATGDHPLPIGRGQTNSQPTTVANMLELLGVEPGMDVLDVGSGSGWTTAILAQIVGSSGSVLGLELVPELTQWGAANLAATEMPWARIEQATPGILGKHREGGYDRILVSAGAQRLPDTLVEQVAAGGRMVIPVSSTMLLVERTPSDEIRVTEHGQYAFVPLIG